MKDIFIEISKFVNEKYKFRLTVNFETVIMNENFDLRRILEVVADKDISSFNLSLWLDKIRITFCTDCAILNYDATNISTDNNGIILEMKDYSVDEIVLTIFSLSHIYKKTDKTIKETIDEYRIKH